MANGNWDAIVHHPIRMQILIALLKAAKLDYTSVREITGATDGNMATHLRKLENVGYIELQKTYQGRRPKTWYWITKQGQHALNRHMDILEGLIRKCRK